MRTLVLIFCLSINYLLSQDTLCNNLPAFAKEGHLLKKVNNLYLDKEILVSTNISLIKQELISPTLNYSGLILYDICGDFVIIEKWINDTIDFYELFFFKNGMPIALAQVDSNLKVIKEGVAMSFYNSINGGIVLKEFFKSQPNSEFALSMMLLSFEKEQNFYEEVNVYNGEIKSKRKNRLTKKRKSQLLNTIMNYNIKDMINNNMILRIPKYIEGANFDSFWH